MNVRTIGLTAGHEEHNIRGSMILPALSVKQPWASLIAQEKKTIETRVWSTDWRGPLVIAASAFPKVADLPVRQALCIVNVADCRPMRKEDEARARCDLYPRAWSWVFDAIWPIVPFAVHGQPGIYNLQVGIEAVFNEEICWHILDLNLQAWRKFKANPKNGWMNY